MAVTATDTGSQGVNLSDTILQAVVQKRINNGTFPADANAIYHVLMSSKVNETSGFCNAYCDFHSHMTVGSTDIQYSFIGNPVHCSAQGGVADCEGLSSNYTQSPQQRSRCRRHYFGDRARHHVSCGQWVGSECDDGRQELLDPGKLDRPRRNQRHGRREVRAQILSPGRNEPRGSMPPCFMAAGSRLSDPHRPRQRLTSRTPAL